MENIFTNLGYTVAKNRTSTNDTLVKMLVIHNTDGTPRWIWNAKCSTPLFLKFYNAGSFRAKLFTVLIKMIFVLKLQNILFKKMKLYFPKSENSIFDCNEDWAVFTGTVGPNNKAILYTNQTFYKIATTTTAQSLIQNENQTIQKLASIQEAFIVPESKSMTASVIQLSDISESDLRPNTISNAHFIALNAMCAIEKRTISVKNWNAFQQLKNDFDQIKDDRIPTNLLRKINLLLSKIEENEVVETTFAHGDFTQWNMYLNNDKLCVYDWELASTDKPKGFDFFHYIIQKGILVDRKNWNEIYHSLNEQFLNDSNELFHKISDDDFKKYLKWYLLICTMQYVVVYAQQPKWHMQVEWLLQTWNDGLNIFLSGEKTSRELIIMDMFDCLHNTSYATLKFTNGLPENLSELSDIDMIIHKSVNKKLMAFLKNHSLISKVTFSPKTFMNAIQVVTNEGDFLAIDAIWQLKVRNLTILNAQNVLKNSFRNSYGVKTTSVIDTTRYVALFYILNGAKIPKKYLVYEEVFSVSEIKLDTIIQDYFIDENRNKKTLLQFIKTRKCNRKIHFIKNNIGYAVDVFRSFFQNTGFTITFSGVDGAGKSTIIENISYQIEKQLRKPVIVLRHRPSILPILSVWTKGKEKAHQDVISSLPRQGKNKNFLSSFVRFAYYYTDYVVGQFIIYCKYILRGYVVIYDRYYFDFINDGKRSNIVLPKWITQFGYYFLLKPKYNFFLFADADTILARKQELSKATIEKLNTDYRTLFSKLQSKSHQTTYKAVKSETVETTLHTILTTIKSN
ncbi:MAG: phosphotransferase [Limnohabitans sp.]|nr:phosphotransferase [Limnohabitans sp.]